MEGSSVIATVLAPIDKHYQPNLTPRINASETIGKTFKKGDIVIHQFKVCPGSTPEVAELMMPRRGSLGYGLTFKENILAYEISVW